MKRYFKVYATKSAKQRVLSSGESDEKSWKEFVDKYEDDDEQFVYLIEEQCYDVLDKLDIEFETSVRGGIGVMWICDCDGDRLSDRIDYQDYCYYITKLAHDASSLAEFKKAYKNYLQSLIKDEDEDEDGEYEIEFISESEIFSELLNKLISEVKKDAEHTYGFNIDVKQTKNTITWFAYEGNPSSDNLVSYFTHDLADYKHRLGDRNIKYWAYSITNELANND